MLTSKMKTKLSLSYHLLLFFFLFLFLIETRADREDKKSVYVVYMGAVTSSPGSSREEHIQLLTSVSHTRKEHVEKTLVHSYKHGFSGFAAHLSEEEAHAIAQKPGVVSVFVDPVLELHTTRSWDFLQYLTDLKTDAKLSSISNPSSPGTDTIIGIFDTGIWPESDSFNDRDMGPIPSRWKGVCMEGNDFPASSCNRKLIGARYYNEKTPRDAVGHGTHTASTAAGSSVPGASYHGLAEGTAKGGSLSSRIAAYRVCTLGGCLGSSILAAFDDAIKDGVDVISLSLGARSTFTRPNFSTDPIAIGAFHAVEKGITVVCSAGNSGPDSKTVVNAAPWILTVAATTIDRDFQSDVVLGGNKVVKGEAINFSNLQKSPIYPLIYAESAKSSSNANDARNCNPASLDGNKLKGKIVLCENSDRTYSKRVKMWEVNNLGGIGLVLIDDLQRAVASLYGAFPMTVVSSREAADILSYINSTRNAVATILPTVSVANYKPAPTVPYFSSRGPSVQTRNILKPDIAAPGVNILAAVIGTNDTFEAPEVQRVSQFRLLSGTSMSCPHVSGIAATIKSRYPSWSPAAIRSAIMTTAIQVNNEMATLTTYLGSTATPYDYGAGEVSPSRALQPGLVYEADTTDYLYFLCNYGYQVSTIKLISNVPDGFDCPKNSRTDLISQLNYPSISISKFNGQQSKKVSRMITNVGTDYETIYRVSVKSPQGLYVKVVPNRLQFTKIRNKLSYQVVFSSTSFSSVNGDLFGSITWTNGKYKVQTPFVVSSA